MINAAVRGKMAEDATKPAWMVELDRPDSSTGRYCTAVLQGAAITAQLFPSYAQQKVALVAHPGKHVRVAGHATFIAARVANGRDDVCP